MMTPLIKYRTRFGKIERIECLRETAQSVFVKDTGIMANKSGERRESKSCDWYQYHDSWDAAHAHLIAQAEADVSNLRDRLESAKGKLGNVKGMKPPADTAQ